MMMDPNSLRAFIRLISKEKDLPPEILKDAIEHAMLAASRKQLSQYRDAVANLDLETGLLSIIVTKTIVEEAIKGHRTMISLKDARRILKNRKLQLGEDVRVSIEPAQLGRIAAQSARQMVMQRLRDAERHKVFSEYKDREGIMVTGIVQRFERRDVAINIGKAEGILPLTEQPVGAHYKFNDRLKVLIVRVEDTPRGPNIILSRKSPQLVVELFKQEVPEIADGTVQIVGIAREAGVRTKIAVKSSNSDVDPVGACVGMKGSRVQMVVRELENEKIDIVPWSNDASTFIRNALNPAKIVGIELDTQQHRASVTVAQGNLAIAIGRKGQNTKLAARLTGYRLDIRSENEEELAYEEIQRRYLEDFLSQIEGLSELYQQAILRSNFNSVEKIAHADFAKLLPFTGDNETLCQSLINGAQEYLEALREMESERRSGHEGDEGEELEEEEGLEEEAYEGEEESEGEEELAEGEEELAEGEEDFEGEEELAEGEEDFEGEEELAEGDEELAEEEDLSKIHEQIASKEETEKPADEETR